MTEGPIPRGPLWEPNGRLVGRPQGEKVWVQDEGAGKT